MSWSLQSHSKCEANTERLPGSSRLLPLSFLSAEMSHTRTPASCRTHVFMTDGRSHIDMNVYVRGYRQIVCLFVCLFVIMLYVYFEGITTRGGQTVLTHTNLCIDTLVYFLLLRSLLFLITRLRCLGTCHEGRHRNPWRKSICLRQKLSRRRRAGVGLNINRNIQITRYKIINIPIFHSSSLKIIQKQHLKSVFTCSLLLT